MIILAICKIKMLGEPVLILGIGRQFMEGDWSWDKYQLFTYENFIGSELIDSKLVEVRSAYHGNSVLFKSINKKVPILRCGHAFDFKNCEQVEITLEELNLLHVELSKEWWEGFDWETWGK